jgi:ferric-dicitrate binding protein FerR (iron transport regulator)
MSVAHKSASARAAELLRDAPLDDLHRARLERRFVEAASARTSANGAPPATVTARRWTRPAGAIACATLAAAAIYALAFRSPGPHYTIAHASGAEIVAGTHFEIGPADVVTAEVHDLALTATASASIRFDAVSEDDIRLSLERGTASFAFHPEVRGEEHVTIETPSARVEIVGTELSVRVDASGTEVTVSEGRVRVVPTDGREPSFVSTGEALHVSPTAPVSTTTTSSTAGDVPAVDGEPTLAATGVAAPTPADVVVPEPGELEPAVGAADPVEEVAVVPGLSLDERLARAEERLETDGPGARRELRELAAAGNPRSVRVEALLLLGEAYRAVGQNEEALEAFARASRIGRGTPSGASAIFDRASLLAAMAREADARAGFEAYLVEYPGGANAAQARSRLAALPSTH